VVLVVAAVAGGLKSLERDVAPALVSKQDGRMTIAPVGRIGLRKLRLFLVALAIARATYWWIMSGQALALIVMACVLGGTARDVDTPDASA